MTRRVGDSHYCAVCKRVNRNPAPFVVNLHWRGDAYALACSRACAEKRDPDWRTREGQRVLDEWEANQRG